ncbi:MAG: IclR family transcriptional regulator [Desertimonas sp.]
MSPAGDEPNDRSHEEPSFVDDQAEVVDAPPATTAADGPVRRAFTIVQLVVAAGEPIGIRELARRSGFSRSSVSRLVQQLADIGLVERTAHGEAIVGPGVATLTRPSSDAMARREHFRSVGHTISTFCGESAAVAVDTGHGMWYVTSARIPKAVQVVDPLHRIYEYHSVSTGLLMMAEWPSDRLADVLARPLRSRTPFTITDPDRLGVELDRIRAVGHAWAAQALDLDVNGLAVPVRDRHGVMIAAASVYGPSYRLSEQAQPALGAELVELVDNIGRRAGRW